MTLVELLVALSVSVLVMASLVLVHQTTQAVFRGQRAAHESREGVQQALDTLDRLLSRGFTPASGDEPPMALRSDASEGTVLSFFALTRPPGEEDPQWYAVDRFRVWLEREGAEGRLLCARGGRHGADPETTNLLAARIGSFRVEVHDGESWRDTWPADEDAAGWPPAVRIELTAAGAPPERDAVAIEVLVPAGHPVSPGSSLPPRRER